MATEGHVTGGNWYTTVLIKVSMRNDIDKLTNQQMNEWMNTGRHDNDYCNADDDDDDDIIPFLSRDKSTAWWSLFCRR